MVAEDPKSYINDDTGIVPMLKMLRDSGRSTFLVTNSVWDYTNIVMTFLSRTHVEKDGTSSKFSWLQYFDVVITGSAKPGFFHEENRANLFEVGRNVSIVPAKGLNNACRIFQGGNVAHLHKLLNIESRSQKIT
ncbi:hypothetical protein Droror1_Dr00024295 [Drosera rotundifolia]